MNINFALAYTKANEMLITNKTITGFPFSSRKLVEEKTSIRCRSYGTALKYGIDINDFGSESAVLMNYHGKSILFFNEVKPESHTNYSILHELAHYILNHKMKNVSSEIYKKQELEANYFAAQILMPEQLLRFIKQQGVKVSVSFLTRNFGVSEQAAKRRIITLGKTDTSWYSNAEKEFDDIILKLYIPMIQHLCPQDKYDFEEEYDMQIERDSWGLR